MTPSDRHQPSQEDLDLARRFMDRIETGASQSAGKDPLFDVLEAYKQSASLSSESSPSESVRNAIFDTIESEETAGETKQLTLVSTFWKIAAVFLAVAGLALAYIIFKPAEPVLLAQSEAVQQVTELPDGSIVTLRPNSSLYELEETDTQQTYRIDGEAYFEVTENRDRLFTAISGDAKVVVTGTEFSLGNWGSAVRVYLESGSVRFSTLDNSRSVNLDPGEYSESSGGSISQPSAVVGQIYTGWLEQELRLNSRTVSDVTAEIEHHFNITLDIPDSIADERLTGSLDLRTSDQVLSDLALSLNGRFVRVGDNRYRFETEP